MTATGLKRFVPRFSLRTLVLFLLLVTSGAGLWYRRKPWLRDATFCVGWIKRSPLADYPSLSLSPDAATIELVQVDGHEEIMTSPEGTRRTFHGEIITRTYAVVDDEVVWNESPPLSEARAQVVLEIGGDERDEGLVCVSRDGSRKVEVRPAPPSTYPHSFPWDEYTHLVHVTEAPSGRVLDTLEGSSFISSAPVDPEFIGAFSTDGRHVAVADMSEVNVYRRRRPEWWWGVFWLWEFWLTAAFGGLFVWSVWRDRRALRRQESPLA